MQFLLKTLQNLFYKSLEYNWLCVELNKVRNFVLPKIHVWVPTLKVKSNGNYEGKKWILRGPNKLVVEGTLTPQNKLEEATKEKEVSKYTDE